MPLTVHHPRGSPSASRRSLGSSATAHSPPQQQQQQQQQQPQGLPALNTRKHGGRAASGSQRTRAPREQPSERAHRPSDTAQHQAVIGLASLLGVATTGVAASSAGSSLAGCADDSSLPGNSTAVPFASDLGQWQFPLSPVFEYSEPVQGSYFHLQQQQQQSPLGPSPSRRALAAGGGSYPELGARRASLGGGDLSQSPGPVYEVMQRLEVAKAELQERLVAAHANYADAQSQVATLKATNRALEAQLTDLRERLQQCEPALDSAQRQLDGRAVEARRALDAAAEAERASEQLEQEVGGLREEVAVLKKELEAGGWTVVVIGGCFCQRVAVCLGWRVLPGSLSRFVAHSLQNKDEICRSMQTDQPPLPPSLSLSLSLSLSHANPLIRPTIHSQPKGPGRGRHRAPRRRRGADAAQGAAGDGRGAGQSQGGGERDAGQGQAGGGACACVCALWCVDIAFLGLYEWLVGDYLAFLKLSHLPRSTHAMQNKPDTHRPKPCAR